MAYWIREFKHRDAGQRYRVASDAKDIPTLRRLIAEQRNDAEWLDDMIYRYDPSLNLEMPGECSLSVQLVR
jgi:hypothetical protein